MRYVALLRGINVGGNNKVKMSELKTVFEQAGTGDVRTYINSGNVIFTAEEQDRATLATRLEAAIAGHFGFPVPVLVRDIDEIRSIVGSLAPDWANDDAMKCDVIFLWPDADRESLLDELDVREGIDIATYTPGAIIWRVDRADVTKSRLVRVVGTPIYLQMTIRNCNTARKLLELMERD